MAPLPVIDDVYRITLQGTSFSGCQPNNVFHVAATLLSVTELADALNATWQENMWSPVPTEFEPTTFTILPLDGTTPTTIHPFEGPQICNGGGGFVPEAAAVVSLVTDVRGPRGRGRVFVGPCGENSINSGLLFGDAPVELLDSWNAFAAAAGGEGFGFVVASYVHEDYNQVVNIGVDGHLGTQRRRLLQTRE